MKAFGSEIRSENLSAQISVVSKLLRLAALSFCMFLAACNQHSGTATRRALSADDAALLAAKLANDQCEILYRKRPFEPNCYKASLQDGEYRWGGLDVGGPGGFSALVIFRQDGGDPRVEVYYSTDAF